jgi:hypothetical protein
VITPTYTLSAEFTGSPGTFTLTAPVQSLQASLAAVVIDSRLRADVFATESAIVPDMDDYDFIVVTDLAENLHLGAPIGTLDDGRKLLMRLENATSVQSLSWDPVYNPSMRPLPLSTVFGKSLYIGFMYNAGGGTWDLIAVSPPNA